MDRANLFFGLCLVGISACNGSVDRPELCAFGASELTDGRPDEFTLDQCKKATPVPVPAGSALFIAYQISSKAEVDANVTFTITTPCVSTSIQRSLADHRVALSTVAPPGAECSLEISATLLNETDHFTFPSKPDACNQAKLACPMSSDAGSADSDGGAGMGGDQ